MKVTGFPFSKFKVSVFERHHRVRQAPPVRFSKGQVCQESWDSFFQKKEKKHNDLPWLQGLGFKAEG